MIYVASGEIAGLHAGHAAFGADEAMLAAGTDGATVLRWELTEWSVEDAKLSAHVELDPWADYVMRCEARRRRGRRAGDRVRAPRRAGRRRRARAAVRRVGRAGRAAGRGSFVRVVLVLAEDANGRRDRAGHGARLRRARRDEADRSFSSPLSSRSRWPAAAPKTDDAARPPPVTVTGDGDRDGDRDGDAEPEVTCSTAGLRTDAARAGAAGRGGRRPRAVFGAAIACDYDSWSGSRSRRARASRSPTAARPRRPTTGASSRRAAPRSRCVPSRRSSRCRTRATSRAPTPGRPPTASRRPRRTGRRSWTPACTRRRRSTR